MSEEMDRIFGDAGSGRNQGELGTWTPAIEVAERDGKYVVHAELPGLKPDEVTVEVTDQTIVIQGERQSQSQNDRGGIHRTERRYGRFYRSIPLPEGVNAADIDARFENGVLELTAPLPQQQSNRRQIPIRSGASGSGSGKTSAGSTSNATSSGGDGRSREGSGGSSTPNA
jgi:HSP20 family protein